MPVLARTFCERVPDAADPFEPAQVIVQSFGIGQWLKLQLAEHHGIAANVDAVLPATYLWRLYKMLIPATEGLDESPFERNRLALRIKRLIENGLELSPAVTSYLSGPGDRDLRVYQLCHEVAGLFDQYLMYRPDWMLSWSFAEPDLEFEPHPHEAWQRKLWRALLDDLDGPSRRFHRASLHRQAMRAFTEGEVRRDQLPGRLSVFGLSTLPPLQLETFEAIGSVIDVDIYFLNPCEHYWGDVVSPKDLARHSIREITGKETELTDTDYLEVGNPILASLGKQGREFFELLVDNQQLISDELFLESTSDTALSYVKNDILNLTFGGEFGDGALPDGVPIPDERSIQLHVCHSRLREVEVLHDQLLHLLATDPELKLSDIIVMVPDVADYAPLVQTIFGDPLHYRVSDRSHIEHSPFLSGFMQLLDLPHSRFTAAEILDLLESPAVARKFGLQQADLDLLASWVSELGIRWEVDGQTKARHWSVPEDNNNTWRFGVDRLLLGFARATQAGTWHDTLAFDITPADTELVTRLIGVIETLERYRESFAEARTMADWVSLLSDLLEDMFEPWQEEILDLGLIRRNLEKLVSDFDAADSSAPISFDLVRHLLKNALTDEQSAGGFLSGGVTFATLVPMRSIPFKVVCLLGMNDAEYPRDKRPHSFDLMHIKGTRKGDRSRKLDDRYLFLEALLSAQDVFYVSYVGRGIRDNQDKPPSVVVGEWQVYLETVFGNFEPVYHPLQPFSPRHYEGGRRQSFSAVWYAGETTNAGDSRFVAEALTTDDTLKLASLSQLEQFFRHSAKYFLQQRLGVFFESNDVSQRDTESFELDNLERYGIADSALSTLVAGRSMTDWESAMLASGQVMTGERGRHQLRKEVARAEAVYDAVSQLIRSEGETMNAPITVGGNEIFCSLPDIYGDVALDYRVGKLQPRHLLSAYIRHLAGSCMGENLATICVSRGNNDNVAKTLLPPIEADEARAQLGRLVALYTVGVERPLFLAPETSSEYARELIKSGDHTRAMEKAITTFSSDRAGSEGQDRYWRRIVDEFREETFAEAAADVWVPLHNLTTNLD